MDWASLVADVRRRELTTSSGGARDRWRPERVLTGLGLSVNMAGKEMVQDILHKNSEFIQAEKRNVEQKNEDQKNVVEQNGNIENVRDKTEASLQVDSLHPVASIQV